MKKIKVDASKGITHMVYKQLGITEPKKQKLKLKRRAIYFYKCEMCGKRRHSRVYNRALNKMCCKCKPKNGPGEGQMPLI